MTKAEVLPGCVALLLTGETDRTPERLRRLVKRALADSGRIVWESVELSFFGDGGQTLVMAQQGKRCRAFYFPDAETACRACGGCLPAESRLYETDGGYMLVFAGNVPFRVREYGQPAELPPLWEVWADERGMRICGEKTVEKTI